MVSARRSSTALLHSRRLDSLGLTASSANLCFDTGPTSSRLGQCMLVTVTSRRQLRTCKTVMSVKRNQAQTIFSYSYSYKKRRS